MKSTSPTRFFILAAALLWGQFALAQTSNGQQRTHGINAPGTSIGPSPGQGTPDPRFGAQNRNDNDANAKSPSAGAAPSHDSASTSGGATQNAGEGANSIWPFALPIAALFIGVPLAFMFWMRRSKTKKEN